jgi:LAO/AO transport system kinase
VLACSALEGTGIAEVWQAVTRHRRALEAGEGIAPRRRRQSRSWLWAEVQAGLIEALRRDPATRELLAELEEVVAAGRMLAPEAARALVARFRGGA